MNLEEIRALAGLSWAGVVTPLSKTRPSACGGRLVGRLILFFILLRRFLGVGVWSLRGDTVQAAV